MRILTREKSNISNIADHIRQRKVEVVYGNLHDPHAIEKAVENCTVICNAAALTDLSASREALFRTNVLSLRMLLEFASRSKLKRFVQISSIGSFARTCTSVNEDTPFAPRNNYDRSKITGEKIVRSYCREKGLPATVLEPSAVYGPRVRIGFGYLLEMLSRRMMRYPVNEHTKLNMLYVCDLVQAVEKAIAVPQAVGERFIIGDEVSYTYERIIETAARELGVPPPRKHVPFSLAKSYAFLVQTAAKVAGRKPGVTVAYFDYLTSDMVLDISKAKRVLGFKPGYSLEQGMKAMVQWFRNSKKTG